LKERHRKRDRERDTGLTTKMIRVKREKEKKDEHKKIDNEK
jgi:hypothetical protein